MANPMFIAGNWHGWQGASGDYLLSDESTKTLREFPSLDDCINWLYVNGYKEAARVANAAKSGK